MIIREANKTDVNDIVRLLQQVSQIHYELRPDIFMPNTVKYDALQVNALLEDSSYYVYVSVLDEKVVGYIICQVIQNKSHLVVQQKRLYIDDLCVDENTRKMNIGKKLCEQAKALAQQLHCYNITLNVWHPNEAFEFYESLGFKVQKIEMEYIV